MVVSTAGAGALTAVDGAATVTVLVVVTVGAVKFTVGGLRIGGCFGSFPGESFY